MDWLQYEEKNVTVTFKNGETISGFIDQYNPADENDGRESFYLGNMEIYCDEIKIIKVI
ncbi:MAG: hypothetical protein LBL34_02700 [Clostridiales bacterium]|jgi:hypothetical protein|nr:hypothetical protein [Clostridiales bacterium]